MSIVQTFEIDTLVEYNIIIGPIAFEDQVLHKTPLNVIDRFALTNDAQ